MTANGRSPIEGTTDRRSAPPAAYDIAGVLPRISDLAVAEPVEIGLCWTPLMMEIAAHIGAKATLDLLDVVGGQHFRISRGVVQRRFSLIIGDEAAQQFCDAFAGEKLDLPVARHAIFRAKASPLLNRVKRGRTTIAQASIILEAQRSRVHSLLQEKFAPVYDDVIPEPRLFTLLREAGRLAFSAVIRAGGPAAAAAEVQHAILSLARLRFGALPPNIEAAPMETHFVKDVTA